MGPELTAVAGRSDLARKVSCPLLGTRPPRRRDPRCLGLPLRDHPTCGNQGGGGGERSCPCATTHHVSEKAGHCLVEQSRLAGLNKRCVGDATARVIGGYPQALALSACIGPASLCTRKQTQPDGTGKTHLGMFTKNDVPEPPANLTARRRGKGRTGRGGGW